MYKKFNFAVAFSTFIAVNRYYIVYSSTETRFGKGLIRTRFSPCSKNQQFVCRYDTII